MNDWYQQPVDGVLNKLETNKKLGLSSQEAEKRAEIYGANILEETGKRTVLSMILEQFTDFMVIILMAAALLSAFLGEVADSVVILAIVVLNAALGVIQESKAEKALAALKQMAAPHARVLRNGEFSVIPAADLVPGDIVALEAGDMVPADGRLIEAVNLRAEESALTGESLPVDKTTAPITMQQTSLGDRKNMVFMGSTIIYGRGLMTATETGMNTQMGKIADLIQSEGDNRTPLQNRLADLGKKLGIAAIVMSILIFALGLIKGEQPFEMFLTAVSLAVAVIPEGLPATVTIVLAVGVQRMIKRNAIIRKLPAVETLGAATVICSDKTGTLTQNKMTVEEIWTFDGTNDLRTGLDVDESALVVLKTGSLANDSRLKHISKGDWEAVGDPTETAIAVAAAKSGLIKPELEQKYPRVFEIPFDSERKIMTTVHSMADDRYTVCVKGAPDQLLKRCSKYFKKGQVFSLDEDAVMEITEANRIMAEKGLRVLGTAIKELPDYKTNSNDSLEKNLVFVGLIGMMDPPREEAFEAVKKAKEAGIKPCMITGDHEITARAIAQRLGIFNKGDWAADGARLEKMSDDELAANVNKYTLFSRVTPEHKLRIVKALQKNNHIVAMTGDGVNDAPALKKADIGAAMGITGTDVAKQSADIILTDDNFATIVAAVEEGRSIYLNIKKSVYYLLSCNAGEILVLFLALLFGWPRPLLPIQILWVNLVTDSLPGLALGLEPPEKGIMKKPPRNTGEKILTTATGSRLLLEGTLISVVTLLAFWAGLKVSIEHARTMAFLTLSFSQKAHAFNKRSETESLWSLGWFTNKYLVLGVLLSTIIQLSVVFIPALQSLFRVTDLNLGQWQVVSLLSLSPIFVMEIVKIIRRLRNKAAVSKSL